MSERRLAVSLAALLLLASAVARADGEPLYSASEYADDLSHLAPRARELDQKTYSYCVRTKAVYECLSYDSDISTADRSDLDRAARCMKADKGLHIAIQGNADERGTEEYNLSLGDRRAHAVAGYLRSLGASESQLQTVSYGEERPLCAEHDEACWAQNRRADLVAGSSKGKVVKTSHKQ